MPPLPTIRSITDAVREILNQGPQPPPLVGLQIRTGSLSVAMRAERPGDNTQIQMRIGSLAVQLRPQEPDDVEGELEVVTGSLAVELEADRGAGSIIPVTTGSLGMTLVHEPTAGTNITIRTGLEVDLTADRTASAIAIATGPANLLATVERTTSALQIATGSAGVTLAMAAQPPIAVVVRTGPAQLRTAPLIAMREMLVHMQMRIGLEQRPGSITMRTGPLNVSMTMAPDQPGFGYSRDLVIAGQVEFPTSAIDRPVLLGIRLEDPAFRSVANGGRLQLPNAGDIEFVEIGTDTVLPHSIVSHDATTGVIVFDLRLPTWNVNQDFRIRMNYGSNVAEAAWWDLPIRSGRASAAGTAYWYDRSPTNLAPPALAAEESDVALIDAMAASSKGEDKQWVTTWAEVLGGAVPGPLIDTATQLDWNNSTPFGFGYCISYPPIGSRWLFWVMQTVPANVSTDGGDNGGSQPEARAIWDEILAETHDARYIALGQRLAAKIDASGHPRNRFIIDANHEMNQSNPYRVYAETADLYKRAMQRTIDLIREGAGFHVRFCHRPGYRTDGPAIGSYASFAPDNADIVALSFHPGADVSNAADIDELFAGTLTPGNYGVTELLTVAAASNRPIAFPEWSPRYAVNEPCAVSNTFVSKFYNDVIAPNQAIIVADCVFNQNIRDPNAYEGTDTAGINQWALMANTTRKTLWSGIKSTATAPENRTAPLIEGSAAVGSILTCNDGEWIGTAPITFTRRWRRDGADFIPAATDSTYTTTATDVGTTITCRVTATNSLGEVSVTSNGIAVSGTATPPGWPYPQSPLYAKLNFNRELARYGQSGDQWPCSEDASNRVLFVGADNNGFNNVERSEWRVSRVGSTIPALDGTGLLNLTDLAMRMDENDPPSGSKPQGVLAFGDTNIAVYYQYSINQPAGFEIFRRRTHVATSTNNGTNFDLHRATDDYLFRLNFDTFQSFEDLIVWGVLQLLPNYQPGTSGIDNDYIYVYLNNNPPLDTPSWNTAHANQTMWLARVRWKGGTATLSNLWERSQYQLFTGLNTSGVPTWGTLGNLSDPNKAEVFVDGNGMALFFNVGWHSSIGKFVATYIHSDNDGAGILHQGIAVAIADTPWDRNGWQMIGYDQDLELHDPLEEDLYMSVMAPSRWNDGTDLRVAVSTYVNVEQGGDPDVIGFPGDNLIVTSAALTAAGTSAPENQELPLVSGLPVVGSELFCSSGEWTGTAPINFTRRWLRHAGNEVAESTKINVFPMEIATPGSRTVTRPSFDSDSSNVITAGANQIIDWRGQDGLQHTPGQTGGHEAAFPNRICTYVINTATATSVFCGGKCHADPDNDAYLNGTWAHCHGNEDFGFNEPGLQVRSSPAGCKFQGFYLKNCCDGIKLWNQYGPEITMPQSHSPTFENICVINCRDDCIEDDALVGGIYRNCYFQGHSILSWRPGAPIVTTHTDKVATFEYCLMHMDRQRNDGDEKWHNSNYTDPDGDAGEPGSRKTGKWISLTETNPNDIANYASANGWAHKWFFKPQGDNMRIVMRHCMLRIDTMPVEGAGEFQIFPNNAASSYEDVDVLWFGPGPWPFAQSQATLAGMGINLITDPAVGFPLWQATKDEWFLLNGYDSDPASPTFDTFSWNRTADDIPGTLGAANPYITTAADVGAAISCRVTATNTAAPDGVAAISSNSITVTAATGLPENTDPPQITPAGPVVVGTVLSCSTGEWTGTAPITYFRQWQRNGVDIAGAPPSIIPQSPPTSARPSSAGWWPSIPSAQATRSVPSTQ